MPKCYLYPLIEKLFIETLGFPVLGYWHYSMNFINYFRNLQRLFIVEPISYLFLVFLLLNLNR